jgi:hypothetical protein
MTREQTTPQQMTAEHMTPEQIRLLGEAGRAPSIHNTQPWRLRPIVVEQAAIGIEILEDRTRRLPVADPTGRERIISCGAAALNASLAMAHLGWEPVVETAPASASGAPIARITQGNARPNDPHNAQLYEAIYTRRTHRRLFLPQPVEPATLAAIEKTASNRGVSLRIIRTKSERLQPAHLMWRGMQTMFGNPRYVKEIDQWARRDGDEATGAHDGVPLERRVTPSTDSPSGTRSSRTSAGMAARDTELARSTVAVLFTPRDARSDWIGAGMALEDILL